MQQYKDKIEAVLFTTGNFMSVEEISSSCGIASQGMVKQLIEELKKDYIERQTALTILEENNKFKLTIKKEFNYLTTNLLNESELDPSTQKTLAVIAYKNPVLQNEVIKVRGNTAYDHIKNLKEQNFIISEKAGRTRLLKLAPKFYDYFDIVEQQLKSKFNEIKQETPEQDIENTEESTTKDESSQEN